MRINSVQNSINSRVYFSGYAEKKVSQINKKEAAAASAVALGTLVSSVAVFAKLKRPSLKPFSKFIQNLADGLYEISGRRVNQRALSCVMDKTEFINEISKLKKSDYTYNFENFERYGFSADFHMHTNYSDGDIEVADLLDEISRYADNLFKRTGKKFIFSITDHDSVEGVKEALSIIADNPEQFRNVKFIPGVELSFTHRSPKSSNPFEISEVLAYGINPFKFDKFCQNLQAKRSRFIDDMLDDIQKAYPKTHYNREELIQFYGLNPDCLMMNCHWPVYHYAQTKTLLTIQAVRRGFDSDKFYRDTMLSIPLKDRNVWYLKEHNLLDSDLNEMDIIKFIRRFHEPHIENGKLVTSSENRFEDLIDILSKDDNVVLSFAHPYFTAEKAIDPQKSLNEFVRNSKGLIQISEGYHQAYPEHVKMNEVEKVNGYLKDLIQIGGSDNHSSIYIGAIYEGRQY